MTFRNTVGDQEATSMQNVHTAPQGLLGAQLQGVLGPNYMPRVGPQGPLDVQRPQDDRKELALLRDRMIGAQFRASSLSKVLSDLESRIFNCQEAKPHHELETEPTGMIASLHRTIDEIQSVLIRAEDSARRLSTLA